MKLPGLWTQCSEPHLQYVHSLILLYSVFSKRMLWAWFEKQLRLPCKVMHHIPAAVAMMGQSEWVYQSSTVSFDLRNACWHISDHSYFFPWVSSTRNLLLGQAMRNTSGVDCGESLLYYNAPLSLLVWSYWQSLSHHFYYWVSHLPPASPSLSRCPFLLTGLWGHTQPEADSHFWGLKPPK